MFNDKQFRFRFVAVNLNDLFIIMIDSVGLIVSFKTIIKNNYW